MGSRQLGVYGRKTECRKNNVKLPKGMYLRPVSRVPSACSACSPSPARPLLIVPSLELIVVHSELAAKRDVTSALCPVTA